MKATDKDKSIHTIPKGTWESGIIIEEHDISKKRHLNTITTDLQGNGYPVFQEKASDKKPSG